MTAPARAQEPLLRRMVVVGDSILAGFSSGGYVSHGKAGQRDSAPALIARQAGVTLPQPLMTTPGLPPPLVLDDRNGNQRLDPGEVHRRATGVGFRSQFRRAVRNLAVPGEDTTSVFESVNGGNLLADVIRGRVPNGRDLLKFLILGLPTRSHDVTQISRARDLDPSFIILWLGNNDLLGMATRTNPDAESTTAAGFGQRFRRLLDQLADTGAPMAVATLPDVTGIAALRHAAGEVTTCRTTAGAPQPVATDDLLSIDLPRRLLPEPLCSKVLDATERAVIRAKVVALNDEIRAAVTDLEVRRGISVALVDTFALFDVLRAHGVDLNGDGTPDLTAGYLGGFFSLDGIHPTRTANALIANAFIAAINQRFGLQVPLVDVARVAATDPLVAYPLRPVAEPPFDLIDGAVTDAIAELFTDTYRDVARLLLRDQWRSLRRLFD